MLYAQLEINSTKYVAKNGFEIIEPSPSTVEQHRKKTNQQIISSSVSNLSNDEDTQCKEVKEITKGNMPC